MNLISVPGPIAGRIIEEINQNKPNEQGRMPKFEQVKEAKTNFIMVGGSFDTTVATFDTFSDNHPGAGIIHFTATPKIMGNIPFDRMIFVGTRNNLRDTKVKQYSMHAIMQEGIQDICDAVMEASKDYPALYISVDLGVLDPAFAPGVSVEHGGLSARELLYFLHRLRLLKNFSAADITGILPGANNQVTQLAAKLISELS